MSYLLHKYIHLANNNLGDIMLIIAIRAFLLYILIIFSLRLMGKRQLGELQPSELVVTILVSNIATLPIENPEIPMIMGVVPIITLVCIDVLISWIMLKSQGFRKIVSGSPRIIIRDGKVDQNELKNLRFTIDDLMEALHELSIFDVREVQYAIVETNGKVNIYQKHDARTVTAEMLNLKMPSVNPPVVIISDGHLLDEGLASCSLSEKWLANILAQKQVRVSEVFLMTADSNGDYFLLPKENQK